MTSNAPRHSSPDDEARDSLLRLTTAALLALLLLALLLPLWSVGLAGERAGGSDRAWRDAAPREPSPSEPEVPVGQDRSQAASVAWIAYEDFRELQARQARTEQPAAQQQVDPTEDAPMNLDATPPAPQAVEPAIAAMQVEAMDVAAAAPDASGAPPSIEFEAPGNPRLDFAPVAGQAVDAEPVREQDGRAAAPTPSPAPTDADTASASAADTTASASGEPATPTSAPRAQMEVAATQLTLASARVQPGRVVAVEGVTINPAHPEISLIARLTGRPRANPQANITFGTDGVVVKVELTRSTGVANWDGPIVASFYRWRASGDKLDEMREPFIVPITFIISEELEEE